MLTYLQVRFALKVLVYSNLHLRNIFNTDNFQSIFTTFLENVNKEEKTLIVYNKLM